MYMAIARYSPAIAEDFEKDYDYTLVQDKDLLAESSNKMLIHWQQKNNYFNSDNFNFKFKRYSKGDKQSIRVYPGGEINDNYFVDITAQKITIQDILNHKF